MKIYNMKEYSFASLEDLANDFKKKELINVYSKLTDKQKQFFLRLYEGGIEKMSPEKYNWAYQQIVRTIIKNKNNSENT